MAGIVVSIPALLIVAMMAGKDREVLALGLMFYVVPCGAVVGVIAGAIAGSRGRLKLLVNGSAGVFAVVYVASLVFTASAKYTNTGENLWMLPPSGFPYAWSFLPDSSAATPNPIRQTIPGCWTDRTCKLKATTSGTLTAYGSFSPDGAATDSVSVHVDVTPCPWKDPIIDSPEVRRQLVKEFQLSATTQLERAGGIYRDSTGRDTVIYSVVPGTATQCRNSAGVGVPGLELIAIWHTHPLAPGQPFTNCPTALPGRVAAQGPSRPYDYDAQKQVNVPEYIIDPRTVFRVTSNPGRRWWQSPQALTSKSWKSCPNWAS